VRHIIGLASLLATLACASNSAGPEVLLSAAISDPAGDGSSADIVSADVEVIGTDMFLTVTFTPESFHSDSVVVQFNFDTDENAATGYTTANPGHVGFGIDCLVEVGKITTTARGARVKRWDTGVFVTAINGFLQDITNGFKAQVPADACEDDGPALLKVDSFRQLSATAYTTRRDWAPDPGQPAAQLR
jgi:hypothetical protein